MSINFFQKAHILALSVLLFGASFLTAQTHKHTEAHCGTPPMTADQIRYTLEVIAKKVVPRNAGMTCVPLQAHIVRRDDGTGAITLATLNRGLANANYYFHAAGIEFFWSGLPNYANNTDYYDFDTRSPDSDTEAALIGLFPRANNAANVYFVNRVKGGTSTGYAYFPEDDSSINTIVMDRNYHDNAIGSTFVHEIGHFFNLAHTFQGTDRGNLDTMAENVQRLGPQANCSTKGDFLCDTEADPKYSSSQFNDATCTYTGGASDIHGVLYTPPIRNIMSYYPPECFDNSFTPNQITRIRQALVTRQGFNNYFINAPPMVVENPSGLVAAQNALSVVLTWADNANNEMGYLIERSTVSDNSGFKPIPFGGTADNATMFTDTAVLPNVTYHYRIKASNDGCNDYSNVVSITPQPAYCIPTYVTNCFMNSGGTPMSIAGVKLTTIADNELFRNENTNCRGALANFTATSANVTVGTTYKITINAGEGAEGCYNQKVGVWLDINDDKDFDDVGEYLGNGTTNPCLITFNITVPANTKNGARRLRVRSIGTNGIMSSSAACGNFADGETEDYTLNVTGGVALPISLWTFQGKNTEGANKLTWQTESEVNAAYFDVERSQSGQNFEKIATFKAFGKANSYVLNDKNLNQSTFYYRLKMVDNNGVFEYSKIIALHAGEHKNVLLIYPNPVTQLLTIETTEEGDRQVINLLGQTVLRSKATQQLDVSALPTGTYVLKIGGQQARFVKQ